MLLPATTMMESSILDTPLFARKIPASVSSLATNHTSSPIVTGTSVVAFKFCDGIVMATDCLASYGSLARFRNEKRMVPFGLSSVIGAAGDISDFQYITRLLNEIEIEEYEYCSSFSISAQPANSLDARNIFTFLHQKMYARRSKMDFLWNSLVVAGIEHSGEPFLGAVDLRGVSRTGSDSIATGFGAYLASPLLRERVEDGRWRTLDEASAISLAEHVLRVLYYRDARSSPSVQIAVINKNNQAGIQISAPRELSSSWAFGELVKGYGRDRN